MISRYEDFYGGLIRGASVSFTVLVGGFLFRYCQGDLGLVAYLDKVLPSIQEKHEEDFGIRYIDSPNVRTSIVTLWMHIDQIKGRYLEAGSYDPNTDTVSIDIPLNTYPASGSLDKVLGRYNNGYFDAKETLSHEVGHFYADRRAEFLGLGDWPNIKPYIGVLVDLNLARRRESTGHPDFFGATDQFISEHADILTQEFLVRMTAEGIAEYFEDFGKRKVNFDDSFWPEDVEGFDDPIFFLYEGGYSVAKPIIDRHGSNGIDYLIMHPPQVDDLRDLPLYRENAIAALDSGYIPDNRFNVCE